MAVYTYGNNNIQFSTFDVWSNAGFTDDTDITLNAVGLEIYPAPSLGSFSVDDLRNTSFLYGTVASTGNGTVEVTAPYSEGPGSSITLKNVDFSVHSTITLTATATYPYNFSEWRTASGGGGTQISTNAALTLSSGDHTSVQTFYAYFV
jgi:hypothetical protein